MKGACMGRSDLHVGFGEVDITPPVGLYMCGSLDPRTNVGIEDPLMAKTLFAATNDSAIAVVGVDLVGLPREIVDQAIDEAVERTGIDLGCIIVSCSHTHSGPYTSDGLYSSDVTDPDYLAGLPSAIAASIAQARDATQPATMHIGRSLVHHYLHNRRVLSKDGLVVNTWMNRMTEDLDTYPQLIGAAGPVDPELWVLRFDNLEGKPIGAFVNFSLHVNTHFGTTYSADYPGVIASEMRHVYGPGFSTVFTPGACANVNWTRNKNEWRQAANFFAEQATNAAKRAYQVDEPVIVDGARRDPLVPRRDPQSQRTGAIERLRWPDTPRSDVFEPLLDYVGSMPEERSIPVNAVRLGPFAIASNPGELFVEHGLRIKKLSPFRHTVVAQLSNDIIGYQPTREAFGQEGYETLVGANHVSIEGIEQLVDTALELLKELHTVEN